jgi:type III secretory pathway component EscR
VLELAAASNIQLSFCRILSSVKSMKGALEMSQLNKVELQNLRHLIGAHDTAFQKMQTYAQQSTDPQVKSYFEKSAQEAQKTRQQLLSFLG